jgi:hypothetical protein
MAYDVDSAAMLLKTLGRIVLPVGGRQKTHGIRKLDDDPDRSAAVYESLNVRESEPQS